MDITHTPRHQVGTTPNTPETHQVSVNIFSPSDSGFQTELNTRNRVSARNKSLSGARKLNFSDTKVPVVLNLVL